MDTVITLIHALKEDPEINDEDIVYLDDTYFRISEREQEGRHWVSFEKIQAGSPEVHGLYGKAFRAEQAAATATRKDREVMSERIASEWRNGTFNRQGADKWK